MLTAIQLGHLARIVESVCIKFPMPPEVDKVDFPPLTHMDKGRVIDEPWEVELARLVDGCPVLPFRYSEVITNPSLEHVDNVIDWLLDYYSIFEKDVDVHLTHMKDSAHIEASVASFSLTK